MFIAKIARTSLRCNVFFSTFSYPSHLKHLFPKAFLEDGLPEMLSKLGVLAERAMKKSIKTSRDSSGGLGGCGGLGQLWEALAELREALGQLWEGLYIQKLPINRPSGRYVLCLQSMLCKPCFALYALQPMLSNLRKFVFNSRHPDPRRVLGRVRTAAADT